MSVSESRGVDLPMLFGLVAAEAVGEMDGCGARVALRPHVEPLPAVADFGPGHAAVEEVAATYRERGAAPVEDPLHGGVGRSERFDVEGALNGRGLEESVYLEVDGGFAAHVEGIHEAGDADPLRAVECHVVEPVAPLPHAHPRKSQPRVEPPPDPEREDGIGAPLPVEVPVERLVDERQPIGCLPGGLHEVVGPLVPEENEDVLLAVDVDGLRLVAARGPEPRRAVDLRIAVDVGDGALHLPVGGIRLV